MRALVTGATGQDGSYLCELLLSKGYEVHGLLRRSSSPNTSRIDHIAKDVIFHTGDLADALAMKLVISNAKPDEIYNLAAQSDVPNSFKAPAHTLDIVAGGPLRIFEAVRQLGLKAKIYQASSSEMFGASPPPQNENTPFLPQNPYAVAKVAAHHYARLYREAYDMFICCGILFNHESPRRSPEFVTRKISMGAARIKKGLQSKLVLGNIDTYRDWGFAGDYVAAMWTMLQQDKPGDYVVATGETHMVREFVTIAFAAAGLNWRDHVVSDSTEFKRPAEVPALQGDTWKANVKLNWRPKVKFPELVEMMVKHDLELLK